MQMFDVNAIQQPTMPVTLGDKDRTVVHLTYPTVELLDRLMTVAPEIAEIAEKKDGAIVRALYGVIADIMDCNDDGYTFTAEELRDKYRMSLLVVAKFVAAYFEFIDQANTAKN